MCRHHFNQFVLMTLDKQINKFKVILKYPCMNIHLLNLLTLNFENLYLFFKYPKEKLSRVSISPDFFLSLGSYPNPASNIEQIN